MPAKFSVTLAQIIKEMSIDSIYMPAAPEEITVDTAEVNRPGLQLSGFIEYFDSNRIQIFGRNEMKFLENFDDEKRMETLHVFFALKPVAVVIARGIEAFGEMVQCARQYGVPLLLTQDSTSAFMSGLIALLNVELAQRITRHGVLVECYGEGIFLTGDSGVGKSETAIELVKRGHRLIADDAVEIRKVSTKTLVGTAPENIRHFIELRGIGIINARRIFGMGAVKLTEKIDLVIHMEPWDKNKVYDRMGMENQYTEILGISVPQLIIPVKPGRNLAIIIEVAAMNNRQKKMGYNAAEELLHNLGMTEDTSPTEEVKKDWDSFNK